MTITLGWWIIPIIVTLGSFGLVWGWDRKRPQSYGYAKAGAAAVHAIGAGAALVVSLVAWLIWALFP